MMLKTPPYSCRWKHRTVMLVWPADLVKRADNTRPLLGDPFLMSACGSIVEQSALCDFSA